MSGFRLLIQDRVFQLCAFAYALIVLFVTVTQVVSDSRAGELQQLVDPALNGVVLVALVWGRMRIAPRERRFWDLLALAWVCWLLVEGLFFFDLSMPFLSASLTTDALYILYYLIFAVALEIKPHDEVKDSLRLTLRHLESLAGLVAFFGVLIYFAIVVLPEPLGVSLSFVQRDRGYTPLLLVRLSLDLLLLGRLIYGAFKSRPRWRRLYGLLALGVFFFALKDGRAVLVSGGIMSAERMEQLYSLLLTLPAFFVVLAARCRHLPEPEIRGDEVAARINPEEASRTSPLVVYALIVPALHFLLYPLGVLPPTSRAPREVFSLLFIVVLGLMALLHQRLVARDRRRANQELHQAKERLSRSQRLESVGRLAGGVAHDFNNYLTIIQGYCELADGRSRDPEIKESIGYIEEAAEKATHLTRQLLAFGRRQVLRPEPAELNAVVVETTELLKSLLGEDVSLKLDLDPHVGHARVDIGQTEQVLMTLAVNGRDAMPAGGTLSVRTRRVMLGAAEAADLDLEVGSYVSLEVADTGCGMTEDVRVQVFEPYFTTKGPGRGTGLGLSTVHGIMAQSGGAISLESAVDVGTKVRVFFPAATAAVQRKSAPTPPQLASPEATLLVVEDDDQIRHLAARFLRNSGYRVHALSDGPEALERFGDYERIDMLITDIMMAEMDGIELAEALRSRSPELRVLFMSGYPLATLRERQAVLPASIQLLEKPFTAQLLLAKVQEVLAEVPTDSSHPQT